MKQICMLFGLRSRQMHCSESLPFFRKQCMSVLFRDCAWPGNMEVT